MLSEPNEIAPARPAGVVRTWCLCVLVFSLLYGLTCQRGVSWQDSGTFQWRVLNGDCTGQRGLALAHPLYIAAAQPLKWIPIGDLAGRLNFFSGLGMAVALANLAAVLTLLTRRRWIGLLVSAMLSVSHTAWWLSTIAEVYTWSAACLTAELWLLVSLVRKPSQRSLTGLAFVSGLGLCVHNFALLSLPVYFVLAVVLVRRGALTWRAMAMATAGWFVGAGMYLGFIVGEITTTGDIGGAIQSALFGRYAMEVLNTASLSRNFKANMALSGLNFISMLTPLAIIGWFGLVRRLGRTLGLTLAALTAVEILFFIRYPVPDQFTFILPTLVMTSIAAGIGLSVLADISPRARICAAVVCFVSLAALPVFYAFGPDMIRQTGVRVSRGRRLPFRDEMQYWIVPWKHNEDSARRFAVSALGQSGSGSVILADSTSLYPLLVTQEFQSGFDDVLISEAGVTFPPYDTDPEAYLRALDGRTLFVVSLGQEGLSKRLLDDTDAIPRPTDSPVLYRLDWRNSSVNSRGRE